MKKKVAIVTTWYPPPFAEYIRDQAEVLNSVYDITVFYFKFSILPSEKVTIENGLKVHRITFPYLPKKNSLTMKYWARTAAKYIIKAHQKEHFYIVHAHNYLSGFVAGEVYDKTGLPFMNTLHNTSFIDKSYSRTVRKQLLKTLPKAQKIICVGKSLYNHIRQDFNISDNGVIVPNMVDVSKFNISNKRKTPFKFVVIGSMERRKRLPEILTAFKNIINKNAELHVVGDVMEKIDKTIISERVVFHGLIPNDRLPEILSECNCLISFSMIETFGITVIEAMSCGLPVIYSESGGPQWTVPDWAGINVGHSVDKMTIAMDAIINNYKLYSSQKIRDYTIEHYSQQAVLKQLINLIENE